MTEPGEVPLTRAYICRDCKRTEWQRGTSFGLIRPRCANAKCESFGALMDERNPWHR